MKNKAKVMIAVGCGLIGLSYFYVFRATHALETKPPTSELRYYVTDLADTNNKLSEELGDKSVYVIRTRYKKEDGKYTLTPEFFKGLDSRYDLEFSGDQYSDISLIIGSLNRYDYVLNQSDPNLLKERGGNCQAFALAVEYYCNKANIENEFVLLEDHVYNKVIIEGKEYILDITKEVFE